jgi:hypothetical protein
MSESSQRRSARDVLAAEAFAVPASDPRLHHQPIVLPSDPTGIAEPHDVLAAEEFPMPAPTGGSALDRARRAGPWVQALRVVVVAAVVAGVLRALRRRRDSGPAVPSAGARAG